MSKIVSLSFCVAGMLLSSSAQAGSVASLPSPQAVCAQVKSAFAQPLPPVDADGEGMHLHKRSPGADWAVLFSLTHHPAARMVSTEVDLGQGTDPDWFAPAACGAVRFLCKSSVGALSSQIYRVTQGPLKGNVLAIQLSEKPDKRTETLIFYTPDYIRLGYEYDLLDNHTCAAGKRIAKRSGNG